MAGLNKEKCIDGMIWIGETYKKILCREKGSCGIPVKNKRNKCFVHEAEWRGCCRKVPAIPEWVVPGKSKIFLAHKNNLRSKEQGKIFGYFVLERIEMIRPPQKVMPLEVNPTSPLQIKKLEKLQQENEKILVLKGTVYRADNGKPIKGAVIDAEHMKAESKEKTVTDENGAYKLELAVGRYRITVSAQGFETETLEGLEVFLVEKTKQDFYLTPKKCKEGQELKRICWDGKEIVTHRCKGGKWVATGVKCPPSPDPQEKPSKCKEGQKLIQECWDGSKIVTHRCENGAWVATDEECPSIPESPGCEEGAEVKKACWDDSVIVLYRCVDGEWVPTGETCPEKPDEPDVPDTPDIPDIPHELDRPDDPGYTDVPDVPEEPDSHDVLESVPVSIDFTMFETHRSCSLRFKPGGIYLVDALTADVTDTFSRELRNSDIWKNYKKARNDAERKAYIEEGNDLFKEILRRFRETRKAKAKIPPNLINKVELRGELVLFKDPPIFKNHPRASFRGIRRIDGDQFLQQVAAGDSEAEIPYCIVGDPTPLAIIIAEIAKTFKINRATSERILKKFIQLFSNELKEEGKLRIPEFGTFKVVRTSARKGRNPRTGEEIDIPARKTVRFKPAKSLKEAVK